MWRRAAELYLATPSRAYEAYSVIDAAGMARRWPEFLTSVKAQARKRFIRAMSGK